MEEDDQRNQEAFHFMDKGWFFGNSLINRNPKVVRCNSHPSTSSKNASQPSTVLLKAPSLPSRFGKLEEEEDEENDVFGPRMSDLIRQAMPSLPCKIKRDEIGDQEVLQRGPTMRKLTRMSSMDVTLRPSQKNIPKVLSDSNIGKEKRGKRPKDMRRSISLKTLTDQEVQGFQDLGFTFEEEDLSPTVVDKLSRLQMNPSLSEAWNNVKKSSQWAYSPAIPRWIDTKSSDSDMKAQIKFWARAVASNVDQQC